MIIISMLIICFNIVYLQKQYEKTKITETELIKVRKDRDVVMKTKDDLLGILSTTADALKCSLLVSIPSYYLIKHPKNYTYCME